LPVNNNNESSSAPLLNGLASPDVTERTYGKAIRRLMPFLTGCFVLAYLDRFNIGFAQLQLATDLHISNTAYGFGAGIFFLGYLLFEVPSNIVLARVGARRWISRIMILWGIVSLATAFVHSAFELYIARFFLGAAEAGFFPGVVFYLTLWFPRSRRAHAISLLTTAIAVSGIISGPISGLILQHLNKNAGLHGWQWLFLLEGAPSVLAGIATLYVLDDSVANASWLAQEEKALIVDAVTRERRSKIAMPITRLFRDTYIWQLGFVNCCLCMGLYGIGFWLPQLLQKAGAGNALHIGLWSVVPYGVAIPFMVWLAWRSNASSKQHRLLIFCTICESIGLTVSALYGQNLIIAIIALTIATIAILTAVPLFWMLPTSYLKDGSSAAAGIALVNSIGAIAGFASPFLMGALRDATHSTTDGILMIAGIVAVGSVTIALLSPVAAPERRHAIHSKQVG